MKTEDCKEVAVALGILVSLFLTFILPNFSLKVEFQYGNISTHGND